MTPVRTIRELVRSSRRCSAGDAEGAEDEGHRRFHELLGEGGLPSLSSETGMKRLMAEGRSPLPFDG
ncbi:hypothetical protein ACFQ07_05470 [Actinomadura adrarensis]|uniref:Uncharacterized protein n=1 Tax=Actinomadura adrarensis TaxID=1819600 RepID=A0ABW3CDJ2_9ACTN